MGAATFWASANEVMQAVGSYLSFFLAGYILGYRHRIEKGK